MTISKVINTCKPLILAGLQKNIKKISTHLLTVLIMRAIVQIEQRKRNKRKIDSNPEFGKFLLNQHLEIFHSALYRSHREQKFISKGDMTYVDA